MTRIYKIKIHTYTNTALSLIGVDARATTRKVNNVFSCWLKDKGGGNT